MARVKPTNQGDARVSLKAEIAAEIYKAADRLGAESGLLCILGSYGDTLDDECVLQRLKHYNETQELIEYFTSPAMQADYIKQQQDSANDLAERAKRRSSSASEISGLPARRD